MTGTRWITPEPVIGPRFARTRWANPPYALRAQDGPQSAGRWLADVNRQLSVESPLVGGPRFAAGDIAGQVRIVQNARRFQPEQHPHHHTVPRAERTIEPAGTPQAPRTLVQ